MTVSLVQLLCISLSVFVCLFVCLLVSVCIFGCGSSSRVATDLVAICPVKVVPDRHPGWPTVEVGRLGRANVLGVGKHIHWPWRF